MTSKQSIWYQEEQNTVRYKMLKMVGNNQRISLIRTHGLYLFQLFKIAGCIRGQHL